MSTKKKFPAYKVQDFNNESNDPVAAAGLADSNIEERFEIFMEGIMSEGEGEGKISEFVKKMEASFNKRELAFIATVKIIEIMSQSSSVVPSFEEFMKRKIAEGTIGEA